MTFQEISIKNLIPSEQNYRKSFDKAALEELTASIKSKGLLAPILVRPLNGKQKGKFEIVAGHRRYSAASAAGLKTMPAIIKALSDENALEAQVIENTQREDPNPIDEAHGFKRLLDIGKHTPETLAAKLDRSVAYVLGRVKLADLDPKVQDAIASGKLGPGHAVLFTRLKNTGDQTSFLKQILNDDLTVRDAKRYLEDEYSMELKNAPFDTKGCASCAFRSKNQAVLFADLAKAEDICTDKSCYQTKTKQRYMADIEQKKAEGFKVFTDAKKIKKLIEHGSKTSARIVPSKEETQYSTITFPPKYTTTCAKCFENHAFYFYEEKERYLGKEMNFGEICLDKECLDAMLKAGKKEARRAGGEASCDIKVNPATLREKARGCRDRFLLKALTPVLFGDKQSDSAAILRKRLTLCHIFDNFRDPFGEWSNDFFKKFNPKHKANGHYLSLYQVYRNIAAIPAESLDKALFELLSITFSETDCKVMLHMTPEAGIDMARDFEMDEEFLNGKTKEELIALIKELDLKGLYDGTSLELFSTADKKGEIVKAILAQDIVGKVPALVAEELDIDVSAVEHDEGIAP